MMRISLLLIIAVTILKASPVEKPREAFLFYHLSKPAGEEIITRSFKGKKLHQQVDIALKDRDETYRLKLSITGMEGEPLPDRYRMEIVETPPRVIELNHRKKKVTITGELKEQLIIKGDTYLFEPPIISLLYPIVSGKGGAIKLLIPSQGKIVPATLKEQGIKARIINKKRYYLKKYFLYYGQVGIEIFVDRRGRIALVNSQSMGYRIETSGEISSYQEHRKEEVKLFTKRGKRYLIDRFPITLHSKKGKKGDLIMLPDFGITDQTGHHRGSYHKNSFYHDLLRYFHQKGYSVYLPTMERFKPADIERLSLKAKEQLLLKLIKKISSKKRPLFLISLGEGSIFALKMKNALKGRVAGLILINPHWRNYLDILREQAQHPELTPQKRQELLKGIAELALETQSKEKLVLVNQIRFSLDYFRQLFAVDTGKLLKTIDGNIAIVTGSYDLEVNPKNGWFLSSHLQNRGLKTLRYKEFNGLNHYLYKIPYASYAFEADHDQKISGEALRWINRFMKQVIRKR